MKQLLQFYDEVKIAEQEYISLTTDKQRIESEDYHILTEWLERLTPEVEKYREIEEKLKDTNAELILNQYDFSNIDDLKNRFSIEVLTKDFYDELFKWYETAIKVFVPYPKNDAKREEHIIRLITRLMFVWFVKQKKLIPDDLFDSTTGKTDRD